MVMFKLRPQVRKGTGRVRKQEGKGSIPGHEEEELRVSEEIKLACVGGEQGTRGGGDTRAGARRGGPRSALSPGKGFVFSSQ